MTFDLQLPRDLDSAAAARHAVDQLGDALPEDLLGDVRLLVSELVTNSLRHAHIDESQHIGLAVRMTSDVVRVEVSDPGRGFTPPARADDPETVDGWGLYLVATLADRWGVETGDVTTVWFELDCPPSPGSSVAA
jgi:anti-sigma regulatory factor (Ser/Thr protein kinase)